MKSRRRVNSIVGHAVPEFNATKHRNPFRRHLIEPRVASSSNDVRFAIASCNSEHSVDWYRYRHRFFRGTVCATFRLGACGWLLFTNGRVWLVVCASGYELHLLHSCPTGGRVCCFCRFAIHSAARNRLACPTNRWTGAEQGCFSFARLECLVR